MPNKSPNSPDTAALDPSIDEALGRVKSEDIQRLIDRHSDAYNALLAAAKAFVGPYEVFDDTAVENLMTGQGTPWLAVHVIAFRAAIQKAEG